MAGKEMLRMMEVFWVVRLAEMESGRKRRRKKEEEKEDTSNDIVQVKKKLKLTGGPFLYSKNY